MSLLVQIAAEFTGKKAFKEADKGIASLTKSTKKLAGALGVALSAKAIADFGKASVKAFAEDEKSANRLAKAVDNLGLSFANPQITTFIDDLSKASGVADDELRPAFQALLSTTGSLVNSQKMLAQAIDISAGSGVDLATVSQDLANAYVGNTKGLKKYNLGLTQAELKAASFLTIQEKLTAQFSGSNAAYLETYAGKMQLLTTAAGEAQEKIGGALVNALQDVFGAADITELIAKIDILAMKTSNMIDELAWKWKKFWFATSDKAILSQLNPFSNYVQKGLDKIDAEHAATNWRRAMEKAAGFGPDSRGAAGVNAAALSAAEAAAKKRAAELAKATKANTAELKKQAALKKAGTLFDITQIGIIAALKGQISEEDRKRLELQLALEQGNVDEAKKLTYELAIAQGLGVKLAQDLASLPAASNPFAAWKGYLDEIELQAKRIASFGGGTPTPSPSTNVPNAPIASPDAVLAAASAGFAAANQQIKLIVEGGDEVTSLMRFKIQEAAQSGSTTNWSQTVGAWDR